MNTVHKGMSKQAKRKLIENELANAKKRAEANAMSLVVLLSLASCDVSDDMRMFRLVRYDDRSHEMPTWLGNLIAERATKLAKLAVENQTQLALDGIKDALKTLAEIGAEAVEPKLQVFDEGPKPFTKDDFDHVKEVLDARPDTSNHASA